MEKPNYIINEILINILQGAKRNIDKAGVVHLYYDTDKVMLDATLHQDDHLEVDLWIGSDKKITVRDFSLDAIYKFIEEHYGEQRKKHSAEDIQDHKEDLDYHNFKEDQFS